MKLKVVLCLFLFISLSSQAVYSAERFEFYNSIRALGMGGVQIAVVNDETALVANPAALGKLRDYFITIADPEIDVDGDAYTLASLDFFSTINPKSVLNMLNTDPTKKINSRIQMFPSLVLPNFGVGLLGKYRMAGEINGGFFDVDYQNDFAAITGFNFRLFDGRVKLGFNARVINRAEIKSTGTIASNASSVTVSADGKEGLGVGVDVGLIFTAPWRSLPTLAIVARDFGNTSFTSDGLFNSTAAKPDTVLQTYDVGVAFFPIMGKRTRTTFSFEMRDVTNVQGVDDTTKLYHMGAEFNFYDSLFLRLGWHQRYWSAGLEFAVDNYQIQIASYGEEVGTTATPEEDRRYALKFAYRF